MSVTVTLPSTASAAAARTVHSPSSPLSPRSVALQRCPKCGEGLPSSAHSSVSQNLSPNSSNPSQKDQDGAQQLLAQQEQRRLVEELEGQIKILTERATTAVDRLADSEDELQRLRALVGRASSPLGGSGPHATSNQDARAGSPSLLQKPGANDVASRSSSPSHAPLPGRQPSDDKGNSQDSTTTNNSNGPFAMQSRFSSFLSARRSNSTTATSSAMPTNTSDLREALYREQALRQQAEGKLSQANGELEELSAQLFQQANEMVAAERKARAKLEERVEVLERRDREKRKRLERLEGAVARIERVRGLLAEKGGG